MFRCLRVTDANLDIRCQSYDPGGLPWAPLVVLQRLVQVFARYRCKLSYKVPILRPRGADPKTLSATGGFTKACSGV